MLLSAAQSTQTLDLLPDVDFDTWHEHTCRSFSVTQCNRTSDPAFRGKLRSCRAGGIVMGQVGTRQLSDSLVVRRTSADIRVDPRDYLMMIHVHAGRCGVKQNDRSAVLEAGDVALYDQARPFDLLFYEGLAFSVVELPRARFGTSRAAVRPADCVVRPFERGSTQARLSSGVICGLMAGVEAQSTLGATAEEAVLDLLIGCLPAEPPSGVERSEKMVHIQETLRRQLDDPAWTVAAMAERFGMSERAISRLFAADGVSPMRWLWAARLEKAASMIRSNPDQQLLTVALDCGFTDAAHFSRVFRARYKLSPREFRARFRSSGS